MNEQSIYWAIYKGDTASFESGIGAADLDWRSPSGQTMLHAATFSKGDRALLTASLTELGADVNARDEEERTPLHYCARNGSHDSAKILIASSAEIDPIDIHGNTPLWYAVFDHAQFGTRVIELLVSNGASPDAENLAGATPRTYTTENELEKISALFLQ